MVSPHQPPAIANMSDTVLQTSNCTDRGLIPVVYTDISASFFCRVGGSVPKAFIEWKYTGRSRIHNTSYSAACQRSGRLVKDAKRQIDVSVLQDSILQCVVTIPDKGQRKQVNLCLLLRPPHLRPVLFYIAALVVFVILWIVLALEYRNIRERCAKDEHNWYVEACTAKHLFMMQVSLWNAFGHFFMGIAVVLYTYGMCSTNITMLGFVQIRSTRGPLLLVVVIYFIVRILLDSVGLVALMYKQIKGPHTGDPKRLGKVMVAVFFCGPSILVLASWGHDNPKLPDQQPADHVSLAPSERTYDQSCTSQGMEDLAEDQPEEDLESAYFSDGGERNAECIALTRGNSGLGQETRDACVPPDTSWLVMFSVDISLTAAYLAGLVWNYLNKDHCYWNSASFVFLMALVYVGCTACLTVGFLYLRKDKLRYFKAVHSKYEAVYNKYEAVYNKYESTERLKQWLKGVVQEEGKPIEDFGQTVFYIGWRLESKPDRFCTGVESQDTLKDMGAKLRDLGVNLQYLAYKDDTMSEIPKLLSIVKAFEQRLYQLSRGKDKIKVNKDGTSTDKLFEELQNKTGYPVHEDVPKWIIWGLSSLLVQIGKLLGATEENRNEPFGGRRKTCKSCIERIQSCISEEKKKKSWDKFFQDMVNPATVAWNFQIPETDTAASEWTENEMRGRKRLTENENGSFTLNLEDCGLTDIPQKVYALKEVKKISILELSGNFIHTLPSRLSRLVSLKQLRMACSEVKKIEQDALVKGLEVLGLEVNQLTQLDAKSLSCHKIQLLNLRNNNLERIPTTFSMFNELQALNLKHNKLRKLPHDLHSCEDLEILEVRDNPLTIPQEVIRSGRKSILNYQREAGKGTERRLYFRVQVLGAPKAGKTSLIDELSKGMTEKRDDCGPKVVGKQNQLYEVKHMQWVKPEGKGKKETLDVSFFKFDSQELYQQSHKLFRSRKCTPVICVQADELTEGSFAKLVLPWLETCSTIPHATIHLVVTHTDKVKDPIKLQGKLDLMLRKCMEYELSVRRQIEEKLQLVEKCSATKKHPNNFEKRLRQRPDIPTEAHAVNIKNPESIMHLKNKILDVFQDPHLYPAENIPKQWFGLLKNIKREGNDLTFLTFSKVAEIANLTDEQSSLTYAITYFDKCGELLLFKDRNEEEDVVFHDLNRLIEVISSLRRDIKLEDPEFHHLTRGKLQREVSRLENGCISMDVLECLWRRLSLKEREKELLIKLMAKFEICYKIPCNDNTVDKADFMFPWLLPDKSPSSPSTPGDQKRIEIKLVFAGLSPPTYLPTLMVQLHINERTKDLKRQEYWKYGMFVQDNNDLCFLLELNRSAVGDHILLSVWGPDTEQAWNRVLDIHTEMKSLFESNCTDVIATFCIPCPYCRKSRPSEPCTYSDKYLWKPCDETLQCKGDSGLTVEPKDLYPPETVWMERFREKAKENKSAAPPQHGNDLQKEYNYRRVSSLVTGYGPEVLRQILRTAMQPHGLEKWLQLNQPSVHQAMRNQPIKTYEKLFPNHERSVRFTDFSFDDLMVLVKSKALNVQPPKTGWGDIKALSSKDYTVGANILRLEEIYGSIINTTSFSSEEFSTQWDRAEKVILNLGGEHDRILKIRAGGLY